MCVVCVYACMCVCVCMYVCVCMCVCMRVNTSYKKELSFYCYYKHMYQ